MIFQISRFVQIPQHFPHMRGCVAMNIIVFRVKEEIGSLHKPYFLCSLMSHASAFN